MLNGVKTRENSKYGAFHEKLPPLEMSNPQDWTCYDSLLGTSYRKKESEILICSCLNEMVKKEQKCAVIVTRKFNASLLFNKN